MPMVFSLFFIFLLAKFLETSFAMEMKVLEAQMVYFMFFAFTWECMIFSGMIQANFYHVQMFHETGISVALIDEKGDMYDSSMAFDCRDLVRFKELKKEEEIFDGYIYNIHKINAGYVYWKKDVRELEELSHLLEEDKSKLLSEAELVKREMALSEEEERQEIQERICLDLNNQIEEEIDALKSCIQEYGRMQNGEQKLKLLKKMDILMVYIKRYIHLYFTKEMEQNLTKFELSVSLGEIQDVLEDAGIRTEIQMEVQKEAIAKFVLVGLNTCFLVMNYVSFQLEKLDIHFVQRGDKNAMHTKIVVLEQVKEKDLQGYIEKKHGNLIRSNCKHFSCNYRCKEIILEME